MSSDSDKENEDPNRTTPTPSKKPPSNLNPGITQEMSEDFAKFQHRTDDVIRKTCGPNAAKYYQYLFNRAHAAEMQDQATNLPPPGDTDRWWKFLWPGYNVEEVWNPEWTPNLQPDYMIHRKAMANIFIDDHNTWTAIKLRRRNNIVRFHQQAATISTNRINRPEIPEILPPIFSLCPVTQNWYPTSEYFAGRDPFRVGFDIYYRPGIINQIFKYRRPAKTAEDENEKQQLGTKMKEFTGYNEPYVMGTQDKDNGIIYTLNENPTVPSDVVSIGERGPWTMIPAATDSKELRKNRAMYRYKQSLKRQGLTSISTKAAKKMANLR